MQALASLEHLQRLISNPKVKILLARDGELIVGFAVNRTVDEATTELAGIIVQERYTGRGVGKALINAAIESASAQGFRSIIVKTEPFNKRAIGFYEASGFIRAGLTEKRSTARALNLCC